MHKFYFIICLELALFHFIFLYVFLWYLIFVLFWVNLFSIFLIYFLFLNLFLIFLVYFNLFLPSIWFQSSVPLLGFCLFKFIYSFIIFKEIIFIIGSIVLNCLSFDIPKYLIFGFQ